MAGGTLLALASRTSLPLRGACHCTPPSTRHRKSKGSAGVRRRSRDGNVHIEALSTLPATGDIIMGMAAELRPTQKPGSSVIGYAVTLVGAALFVASCFMSYYGYQSPEGRSVSLYDQMTVGGDGAEFGGVLFLFGGVATVLVLAIVGLSRGQRTAAPVLYLLAGVVAAWSLTWMGLVLQSASLHNEGIADLSLEMGFWLQAVSIGVVVIGTILVGFGKRSEVKDSQDRYANEERVDTGA